MSENVYVYCYYNVYWHASIVVFNTEYSYGQEGVTKSSQPGNPTKFQITGTTNIKRNQVDKLITILQSTYNSKTYNPIQNNCVHFAAEIAMFLCEDPQFPDFLHVQDNLARKVETVLTSPVSERSSASFSSFSSK